MYHYPPATASGPSGLVPQSDGRRLVFPLSQWTGTFKTHHFLPSIVDYRCSLDEINYFLNDIYYSTRRMEPIRTSNRWVIWSFIMYILVFVYGVMLESDNSYVDDYEEIDDTGVILIFGGFIALIIFNVLILVYRSTQKWKLYKQVVNTLERHKNVFLQKGLRWAVPENLNYLELWMDYRFFSPYYMQYIPAAGMYPQVQTALPYGQPHPQQTNLPYHHTLPVPTTKPNTNQQAQPQIPQGYPVANPVEAQSNSQEQDHSARPAIPNSTQPIIPHQGYPTFQGPVIAQPFGFYQSPTLTENLLPQGNEDPRLMRPY